MAKPRNAQPGKDAKKQVVCPSVAMCDIPPAMTTQMELSAEVIQLVAKLGVSAFLSKVLEMTQSVFPKARLEVEAYQ